VQARALAYADDGYIKAKKMSVALQVLADLQHVLDEDGGVDLNVSKTSFPAKGVSQQAAFDVAYNNIITNSPTLATLSANVSLAFFCPDGFVAWAYVPMAHMLSY
jgi:hypothetical protein